MVITIQNLGGRSYKSTGVHKHSAFSMIELVFAIVIIGVSMLTIPMLMRVDATNQEDSLLQEGIMLTSTKVSQVLTYPWDANSSPGGGLMTMTQALETGILGAADLTARQAPPNGNFRIGHFTQKLRRRLTPVTAPRTAGAIGAAFDGSISGFNTNSENIAAVDGQYSYKKQWRLDTVVTYVEDNATYTNTNVALDFPDVGVAGPTNIKMVEVTATDVTPNSAGDTIVLRSYSSNIGEAEFYKRRY